MFDYIFCPAKYNMKYCLGYSVADPISLPRLLSKVSKYFYFNLLNGKVCSLNDLKSKWDSICKQYPDFLDAKKNLAGYGLIVNLIRWASDEQIIVGDVDENYKLFLDGVEFTGSIDTILIRKDKKIELLYTHFSDKDPDQFDVETKLKYTLDSAAFLSMHGRPVDGIRIHCTKSCRDYMTYRTDPDYNRLKTTINSVATGIENKIFYPRESPLCASCTGKEYCKYWNGK
jgi:hypothetical protein